MSQNSIGLTPEDIQEMTRKEVNRNLDNYVELRCGVIGIGNAGNQVLNKAAEYEFDTFAINSSRQDLSDALVKSDIVSFIIGKEARGAGKNRTVAKQLFKMNGRSLVAENRHFEDLCTNNDVIVVVASTAGGTGSGVAPDLIKILQAKYPSKIIIFYGILPRATDSVTAQQNSVDCLIEVTELKVPYILADLEHFRGVANDIAYSSVCDHVVDNIRVIKGAYLNKSSYGMIDENDMRTTIASPGYISIYNAQKITQKQIDTSSAQKIMIDLIKNSPAVDIARDGNIQTMAAILNMPESMEDVSKTGDYEELINFIGRPITTFENYAVVNAPTGQFTLILAGQTIPMARINVMNEISEKAKAMEEKRQQYAIDSNSYGRFSKDMPSFLTAEADTSTVNDVLDDFFS